METQTGRKIEYLRSNNETVYIEKEFQSRGFVQSMEFRDTIQFARHNNIMVLQRN